MVAQRQFVWKSSRLEHLLLSIQLRIEASVRAESGADPGGCPGGPPPPLFFEENPPPPFKFLDLPLRIHLPPVPSQSFSLFCTCAVACYLISRVAALQCEYKNLLQDSAGVVFDCSNNITIAKTYRHLTFQFLRPGVYMVKVIKPCYAIKCMVHHRVRMGGWHKDVVQGGFTRPIHVHVTFPYMRMYQ